jgi:hypothetical protein
MKASHAGVIGNPFHFVVLAHAVNITAQRQQLNTAVDLTVPSSLVPSVTYGIRSWLQPCPYIDLASLVQGKEGGCNVKK